MADMDPIAELQHLIREARHEAGGSTGLAHGLTTFIRRGDSTEDILYWAEVNVRRWQRMTALLDNNQEEYMRLYHESNRIARERHNNG